MRKLLFMLLSSTVGAQTDLFHFNIDQDRLHGGPDFSYLNHPLGPADRLFVRDGHFYRVGPDLRPNTADDERVRLFGFTFFLAPGVIEATEAPRVAKRLRRLGVNVVRYPAAQLLTKGPLPTLNSQSIARFRAWLNAFKAEGIYLYLIFDSGYVFRPDVDKVPPIAGLLPEIPMASRIYMWYPRLVEAQAEYARKLIEALELKDDPVLAVAEVHNEGSMTRSWQQGDVDKYLSDEYRAELARLWNAYLREKYGTTEALRAVWTKERGARSLLDKESMEAGNIGVVQAKDSGFSSTARVNDYIMFMADLDRRYFRATRDVVHRAATPLVPVTGTQTEYGGILNLDAHREMDFSDNHFYTDHPNSPGAEGDQRDWRIRDYSSVGDGLWDFLNNAAIRVAGRPHTVSEYQQHWPNRQTAEIDPTLAIFASFQDWDGLMHCCYSTRFLSDPNSALMGFNPTQYSNIGQAAWLFRTFAVQAGKEPLTITVPKEVQLEVGRQKRSYHVADILAEFAIYQQALALIHPVGMASGDAGALPSAGSSPYRSDTDEMIFDRERKIFVVQAPSVAGAYGFFGVRKKVTAGVIDLELAPGARGFAAILLTALDQKPLRESGRILLSTPGYSLATQPGSDPPQPQHMVPYRSMKDWWTLEKEPAHQDKPSGLVTSGIPPVWMERVESFVTLRTAAHRLQVYPLDGTGERQAALPAQSTERVPGGFRIHLQALGQQCSAWYELDADLQ
jgi:hypothetical protein